MFEQFVRSFSGLVSEFEIWLRTGIIPVKTKSEIYVARGTGKPKDKDEVYACRVTRGTNLYGELTEHLKRMKKARAEVVFFNLFFHHQRRISHTSLRGCHRRLCAAPARVCWCTARVCWCTAMRASRGRRRSANGFARKNIARCRQSLEQDTQGVRAAPTTPYASHTGKTV
jgi:hypothetical protein